MQTFKEFMKEYTTFKKVKTVTPKEFKELRRAYESLNSKKARVTESKKNAIDDDFEAVVAQYSKYKESMGKGKKVSMKERVALRKNLKEESEKLIEESLDEVAKTDVVEMVKTDFECGLPSTRDDYDSLVATIMEDKDISEEEASDMANYYFELVDLGPSGFISEFPELDYDEDFLAEYGDNNSDDDDDDFDDNSDSDEDDFDDVIAKYSMYKESLGFDKKVTMKERVSLKEKYLAEKAKLVEAKKADKEFEGIVAKYSMYKESLGRDKKVTMKERLSLKEKYLAEKAKLAKIAKKDAEFEGIVAKYSMYKESLGHDKVVTNAERKALKEKLSESKKSSEITTFTDYVNKYREWKKENNLPAKLQESEKKALKESFFGKKLNTKGSPVNKPNVDKKFTEAVNQYREWKKVNLNESVVTETEKAQIKEQLFIESINNKITQAKKLLNEAQVRIQEGDMMDGAAAVNDAGAAVNMAGDMAADPMAMGAPAGAVIPPNVVEEISQIKAAVDALATEAGITSPVDLGANPNAGVPPVADAGVDPNAMLTPQMESLSAVKARLSAREAKLKEGKYFQDVLANEYQGIAGNKNIKNMKFNVGDTKVTKGEDSLIPTPKAKDLSNGTAVGKVKCKPGETWKPQEIKYATSQNIQESTTESTAKKIAESCDEDGNFSWEKFIQADS